MKIRNKLFEAVGEGDVENLRNLLAKTTDTKDYNDLLLLALERNFPEVAISLLENKADPNLRIYGDEAPIFYAVVRGNIPLITSLLNHKANLDIQNCAGKTALHKSVISINQELVKLLLDNKANPNIPDDYGDTPIFYTGNADIFKLLLEHNADIDLKNNTGDSIRKLVEEPNLPPYSSHLPKILSDYLIREQSYIKVADEDLWHAESDNKPPRTLAPDEEMQGTYGAKSTAGIQQVREDLSTSVTLALPSGVEFSKRSNEGIMEEENLWVAVRCGNVDGVRTLLETLPPAQDYRELLSIAVAHKLHKIVALLLEHKADPNIQNAAGQTVLHQAARQADEKSVKLLLDNKANPNIPDDRGDIPIFFTGNPEIFRRLLESNTNIDFKNTAGDSIRGLLDDLNLPPYSSHLPKILSDYLIREQWHIKVADKSIGCTALDDRGDLLGEDNLSSSE